MLERTEMMPRIGFGYDSHRFEDAVGKPLVLGGVTFPGERGLKAHSDGDVVIHAVIDAVLGATALGNVGQHFPDTDERYRSANSRELLAETMTELAAAGWRLGNLDVTVICERPRLAAKIDEMRCALANALKVDVSRVSVKGKTNERMDDVGAGLGIEVHAVALVVEGK